ncbi:unnamed protein product [Sympodiomycopsis kandeliae]
MSPQEWGQRIAERCSHRHLTEASFKPLKELGYNGKLTELRKKTVVDIAETVVSTAVDTTIPKLKNKLQVKELHESFLKTSSTT